ncbi:MAG: small multi-drug export protein [Elusimicrobiota bacterium]
MSARDIIYDVDVFAARYGIKVAFDPYHETKTVCAPGPLPAEASEEASRDRPAGGVDPACAIAPGCACVRKRSEPLQGDRMCPESTHLKRPQPRIPAGDWSSVSVPPAQPLLDTPRAGATGKPTAGPLLETAEWRQIVAALTLATLTLFGVGILFRYNAHVATTLLSSIGLHAAGARAPAVLFCLARGLPPIATLLFNFCVEIIIVVLCYYVFVLAIREGIETRFLKLAAKRAEATAQKHCGRLKRYERVGLFFFVMAPFAMTGPVTGAFAGYLLNLKPWVTFSIVFSGTFCALSAYVLLGQSVLTRVIALQNEYQGVVSILIAILIAGFTIYHVRSIAGWVKRSVNDSMSDGSAM